MKFIVRTERLPIVEVEFPSAFTVDEYEELFVTYCALSLAHGRIAYLIDMRAFSPLGVSAADRKNAARVFNANVSQVIGATVCEARVVSSELTRGILTAFDWLTGTKWPCRTFTLPADAETWLQRELAGGAHFPSQQGLRV